MNKLLLYLLHDKPYNVPDLNLLMFETQGALYNGNAQTYRGKQFSMIQL